MQDFHKLLVWQKAHRTALTVYAKTATLPRQEMFGLQAQMRRSAVSVPANIAEGCGRGGRIEFRRFLKLAMGSASELEYQLLLVRDLGWMQQASYDSLREDIQEVKRMLAGLVGRLNQTEN